MRPNHACLCPQVAVDMFNALGGEPPLLWSAEQPNLYVLVLQLTAADGTVVEVESCQVRV